MTLPSQDPQSTRFLSVRRRTLQLCEPLETEDFVVQSMPDVSPTKWHLAHTTWFFDTFILEPMYPGYEPLNPAYKSLFNSYYQTVGTFHPRPHRGDLSRPTVAEIVEYRAWVEERVQHLLDTRDDPELMQRLEVGLNHEEQHQELLLMDIKHVFSCNPLDPAYLRKPHMVQPGAARGAEWKLHTGGIAQAGADGESFCYDNERPRHQALLQPFRMADRLVTNGEFLAFMIDGGYERPELWLSDGWDRVQQERWRKPIYWEQRDGVWLEFTLCGTRPVVESEPVVHVSFYEADAYARWADARLPSEQEWETLATGPVKGNFLESGRFHPAPAGAGDQLFGDVWEWTASPYRPYPGFQAMPGALGEYNGKFMSNQMVLRGGACVTWSHHARRTYRNFYYPHQRWAFSGFRLAQDAT